MSEGRHRETESLAFFLFRVFIITSFFILFRFTWRKLGPTPSTGPLIFVLNHQSYLDPIISRIPHRRTLYYMARSTLFRNRLFGWFIRSVGAVPVDREGTGLDGIRIATKILKDNGAILIFPDATRSADGTIGAFKPGFVWLAQSTGAAVQPIVLCGANRAWNRNAKMFSPRKIRATVLPAIDASAFVPREGETKKEAQERCASEIREMMAKTLAEMEAAR